ncbi:MAG: protein ImuB, partial [Acidimicrobiia bacterium]|nr:protein ImuB [Acidimicrobiia bacterium]
SRTLVVWCFDWPVRAWGIPPDEPAAVLEANRVTASSPAARDAGVGLGLRRREAQARCPELTVLKRDPAREARAFEPVVATVQRFAPVVEVDRPGVCALATRGPSRYFGGDASLADSVGRAVEEALGGPGFSRVGLADGYFAASWAARWWDNPPSTPSDPVAPVVVAPAATRGFLAPLPLDCLEAPELVEVLWQLGLRTLGNFAALPEADVLARFGTDAAGRHRLARGVEDRLLDTRTPTADLAVSIELDPPVERVDQAAFAAKSLADQLHDRLTGRGEACTRLAIEAETEHGEVLLRLWRHEGVLSPAAMADRVRWQLEGWLASPAALKPSGGLSRLTLAPDDVVAARGRQLGFWGGETQAAERAARSASRVAGLLGSECVTIPQRRGGRGPAELFDLLPVAAVDLTEQPALAPLRAPWPGRLPVVPATVMPERVPLQVEGAEGEAVTVSGRGQVNVAPALVDGVQVVAWAGPWPLEERWWDPAGGRRQARFQVVLADGTAHLLVVEGGAWWRTGIYD